MRSLILKHKDSGKKPIFIIGDADIDGPLDKTVADAIQAELQEDEYVLNYAITVTGEWIYHSMVIDKVKLSS